MRPFILLAATLVVFLLTTCRKSQLPGNAATIVGWNNGYCMTCGGFYFNASGDSTINAHTLYAINYAASVDNIVDSLHARYHHDQKPIYVYMVWRPVDSLHGNPVYVEYVGER